MPGGLLNNFREGNRSELLADYLLSSIGITTPVRRQDDYGFDFYCQLSDQESGYLTFGYPFIIQIKSDDSSIEYGSTSTEKWKPENITWLFRNQIPFFVGIVDKKAISIKIYDATGLWQIYNSNPFNCSHIIMQPVAHPSGEMRANQRLDKIENWSGVEGDGYTHQIDLGNAIVELSYEDLNDIAILRDKKLILRGIIGIEQLNIMHRNLGIRGFMEIKYNDTNTDRFFTGMNLPLNSSENIEAIYLSLRTGLLSQLINLANHNRTDEMNAVKNLLKFIPKAVYYDQLYEQHPTLFDWTKEI